MSAAAVKLGRVEKDVIKFSKYHGAGNDLIMVNNTKGEYDQVLARPEIIRAMCARRFGVGSDGVVELKERKGYAFEMVFYKALGEKGSFGGNAARCSVAYAYALDLFRTSVTTFMASDGPHTATYSKSKGVAEIDLGDIDGATVMTYDEFFIDTGCPHHIVFVKEETLSSADLMGVGQQLCDCEQYKGIGGTNVNFVYPDNKNKSIRIRTYERGVRGEIMACGTGAVASAIAHEIRAHRMDEVSERALTAGEIEQSCRVICPLGELEVRYVHQRGEREFKNVRLIGPVAHVYNGQYRIPKELRKETTK